jgi:hypothetical protein
MEVAPPPLDRLTAGATGPALGETQTVA